jgi:metal-dependent HD superfamily phosphatase/phosphodiesterase
VVIVGIQPVAVEVIMAEEADISQVEAVGQVIL